MRSTETLEQWTRRFRWPVAVAALLVIPAVALDARTDQNGALATVAGALNWAIWLVFAAEYVVLVVVAPDRWRWFKAHPLDLLIVLATPPFAPALVQGLRASRLLRVLRLLRLGRTMRVGRDLFSAQGLQWAATLTALTVVGGGVAFTEIESRQHLSAFDGLWWAATTITTVGYGDVAPHTTAGRLLSVAVVIVGICSIALLTGAVAERFVRGQREITDAERHTHAQLDELQGQLATISARLVSIETTMRNATE